MSSHQRWLTALDHARSAVPMVVLGRELKGPQLFSFGFDNQAGAGVLSTPNGYWEVWTTAPRSGGHHAWEAQRNLNQCVSCHSERDCTTCHATRGVGGGMGVNPHPVGFENRCGSALRKNPRPCLVCHATGDGKLEACR